MKKVVLLACLSAVMLILGAGVATAASPVVTYGYYYDSYGRAVPVPVSYYGELAPTASPVYNRARRNYSVSAPAAIVVTPAPVIMQAVPVVVQAPVVVAPAPVVVQAVAPAPVVVPAPVAVQAVAPAPVIAPAPVAVQAVTVAPVVAPAPVAVQAIPVVPVTPVPYYFPQSN